MAIRRFDPVGELVRLRERLNRLFDETLAQSAPGAEEAGGEAWRPPLDLFEEPDRYVLRADLPGVGPGDFEVRVTDGTLTVSGERRRDPAVPGESYLRAERQTGPFRAEIALPPSVDPSGIQAVQRAGVVEVVLPKRRREPGPGRIRVRAE